MNSISFKVYNTTSQLPNNWDDIAISNIFLQQAYLKVLEQSAPTNMQCFYIGIFNNKTLIGVVISQYLNLQLLDSFGDRDQCIKACVRNFVFKHFASHVLFIGNNMVTGQNSYAFATHLSDAQISDLLLQCAQFITLHFKKNKIKIHIVLFKDFYKTRALGFKKESFKCIHAFTVQPNMVFTLREQWENTSQYIADLSKKYRDQYKRAHKKTENIVIQELSLDQIIIHQDTIYKLYYYVAKNAAFNTFFLAKNHFSIFKEQMQDRFKLYGYFYNNQLVGFHSILLNGVVLETYFLGYDHTIQKEKMLYLNMLYQMTFFGINNGFKKINFGRTALEIKSGVGANPIDMYGFIYHTNYIINAMIPKIFKLLEPKVNWQQRHPFK